MCLCGGTCNCSLWVHDSNDSNAITDYVIGSLHEGFMKGMMMLPILSLGG